MLSLFEEEKEKKQRKPMVNSLNNLSAKEWVFNTNSIECFESTQDEREFNKFLVEIIESRFPTNGNQSFAHHIRKAHPSPKPPQLMERLIKFFSKENEIVFDPFCGAGSTLLAATLSNRKAIGLDLSKDYFDIYLKACQYLNLSPETYIVENSKNIDDIKQLSDIEFDLVLTDPPYGNMMAKNKTGESAKKKKNTSPTPFTTFEEDIGNLDIPDFLIELKEIIQLSFNKLKNKRYIIVFLKDFQPKPDYHGMLHFDVMKTLTEIDGLLYKGFKIWYDKTINLYPYGYPYAYVGNQLHQYIMIFRKDVKPIKKNKK